LYPGRAALSPLLDVLITLLQWGTRGWRDKLEDRERLYPELLSALETFADSMGERVLSTPGNPISVGLTLDSLGNEATFLGSMLFSRCASGARVVVPGKAVEVSGIKFNGYGASYDAYPHAYMTVAAALGSSRADVAEFIRRLELCVREYREKHTMP